MIDDHSDWILLAANETGTTTYLKFSRLLETCDEQDYPITVSLTALIIYMAILYYKSYII